MVIFAVRRVKRKAMSLHRKYNCQVFVVKVNGKLTLISRFQFKTMRQNGLFPKNFTASDLKRIALFYTPRIYDKKGVQGAAGKV